MKARQKLRLGLLLSSFFLFPAVYYYLSPYLVVDAATKGIANGSFVFFLAMFVCSLVLGRAFCGWACPAGGCQEAIAASRSKRTTQGNWIKWVIWVPWVSAIAITVFHAGGYTKVDVFYQTTYGMSIGNVYGLVTYLAVLLLIALPAFVVGRRSFCHCLCWIAPFMMLGRKLRNVGNWPSLRLAAAPGQCAHCNTCTTNCPMSLPVQDMVEKDSMESAECILCGTCVDGCEGNAIRYRF